MEQRPRKPVIFNPAAKRDWDELPEGIQDDFGHALRDQQYGKRPPIAKTFGHHGSANLVELVERDEAGTYRAVYTLEFEEAIFVLHAFKKKSAKGIATNKSDLDLVERRRVWAADLYAKLKKEGRL